MDSKNSAPLAARSQAMGGFTVLAKAPEREGVSQVVFWRSEPGRAQAVAGAAYVNVASRSSGVTRRSAALAGWTLRGVTRVGSSWNIQVHGLSELELSSAVLLDAAGHRQEMAIRRQGGVSTLSVSVGRPGTHFLKLGTRTIPVALVR